ncbi:MAG TPA: hypothetical protein VMU17_00240 [Elusimicrobiota bacterium]|nr:hypothetical protein [Elusimicrobiota bacterium]
MKPVVQREPTGCGIASVAALAGVSYARAKRAATALGIEADDRRLWSETSHIRRLLKRFRLSASAKPRAFRSWTLLPDIALLATKWHREAGKPVWHWAVFVREGNQSYVLDSKNDLRRRRRTDFGRIKPKWSMAVHR